MSGHNLPRNNQVNQGYRYNNHQYPNVVNLNYHNSSYNSNMKDDPNPNNDASDNN